jgi:ABC-2 type transport system ATP-binding protein
VTFALRRGEIFGLLGPNGAGKSTAIRCLCGLLTPANGSLALEGRPFAPSTVAADRSAVGIVPQELALYADLTARENLAFFGALCGLRGAARRSRRRSSAAWRWPDSPNARPSG